MRRRAPRHLALALESLTETAAPPTVLARVQAAWPAVAGEVVAAEATPISERSGTLTVTCGSAAWAHELSLAGPEIVKSLNDVLEPSGSGPLKELRAQTASPRRGRAGRAGVRFP